MLNVSQRTACALLLPVFVQGCFSLDFGSGDTDIEGCGVAPHDVTMDFADRYALGATTTISLSGLREPKVTSSDPDVVQVSAIDQGLVTLSFVGEGEAEITVAELTDTGIDTATATVTVARVEGFRVVIPFCTDHDVPLAGKAVIDPELRVAYFDSDGPLYGRGLAETPWERDPESSGDSFFNDGLEPGPQQVEVRAAGRLSVIHFEAVARDEVEALELVETDLGDRRIRVELVGVTGSGTQVWNIDPYFRIDQELYCGRFEYRFEPGAAPSVLTAGALAFSGDARFELVETTIYRAETGYDSAAYDSASYASGVSITTPSRGGAPLSGLVTLALMALCVPFAAGPGLRS